MSVDGLMDVHKYARSAYKRGALLRMDCGGVFIFLERMMIRVKYEIDSNAVQQRALTLGRTSTEVALGAGISVDTIQAIYRQDVRQYTERIVMGLSKSLEMKVQDFATRV